VWCAATTACSEAEAVEIAGVLVVAAAEPHSSRLEATNAAGQRPGHISIYPLAAAPLPGTSALIPTIISFKRGVAVALLLLFQLLVLLPFPYSLKAST
jgi:hypothetical protein